VAVVFERQLAQRPAEISRATSVVDRDAEVLSGLLHVGKGERGGGELTLSVDAVVS